MSQLVYEYQKRDHRRYFAQPTARDVRPINPVLSGLSIAYKNDHFLWDKIAPPAQQAQQTGTYMIYTRDFWMRRQAGAVRSATGFYLEVGYGVTNATYSCFEIGFEKPLGDVVKAASQTPEDLQVLDTQFITNLIQLELEKRIAAAAFVTGAWGTSTTLTTVDQWSDYANSDPIANIDTARRVIHRATGAMPNVLFVGLLGWEKLKEHPNVLDKYKYTQAGVMTPQLVAAVLGVDELVVGDSVENTANEGSVYVGADIWTDNALLLCRNNPALGVANGAYTFMWDERNNIPWAIEDYRDEKKRSDIIRGFTHIAPVITSAQHGYLYLDLVA